MSLNSLSNIQKNPQKQEIKRLLGLSNDSHDFLNWAEEKKSIMVNFWHNQTSNARVYVIGFNVTLLNAQIKAIMNPLTPEHLVMN